ncbi:hypothetical protein [Methylobacterium sp. J-090]|uniref:hypothetical protein n=1 Tax=Methylobacterium sp. J-090 TaxID=2836666 RepID=UPI001FBC0019|nr:hypothetical protein [Methylobacterium sp. J-090]MCJ2083211.1 hypothetical protein [Methylobacterium sp. J-090]
MARRRHSIVGTHTIDPTVEAEDRDVASDLIVHLVQAEDVFGRLDLIGRPDDTSLLPAIQPSMLQRRGSIPDRGVPGTPIGDLVTKRIVSLQGCDSGMTDQTQMREQDANQRIERQDRVDDGEEISRPVLNGLDVRADHSLEKHAGIHC